MISIRVYRAPTLKGHVVEGVGEGEPSQGSFQYDENAESEP